MMQCQFGGRDNRGRVTCTLVNNLCPHVYFCELVSKWKQTDRAYDCPVKKEAEEHA